MPNATRIFNIGIALVVAMVITLAYLSYLSYRSDGPGIDVQIERQIRKISLINELSSIIHDRTRFMQSMLLDKEFVEHEALSNFSRMNGAYSATRKRLDSMLAPREQEIMRAIDHLNEDVRDLNRQVSLLFLDGSRDQASQLMITEVLPKTAPLLSHLAELTQMQRLDIQKMTLLASQDAERSLNRVTLFSIVAVLISLVVTLVAIWYGRKLSGQLLDVHSYLEQKIHERTESLLDTQRELLEDKNELQRLALTDNLTGLSNRAHMNQILHKEFSRFERHNQRFGIIMLDIDHFKSINDRYGHIAGDSVLKRLASTFESAIRTSDFIARWGGEEFLICCTTIEEEDLLPIAETIRQLVASTEFEQVGQITASLGCAAIVKGETIGDLIKRADVALYEAKNNGRNQSIVSEFTDISLV